MSTEEHLPADLAAILADAARLAALARTGLADSPAEPSFDRLARLASKFLGVPVALVSLVDAERQFFKSCVGLHEPWASQRETPLSHSFCQHVVASAEPLVIADARLDPRVKDNGAIADIGVIAYLGVPITINGEVIGSFCAIDGNPKAWTADDVATMSDLAQSVISEIVLRTEHRTAQAIQARTQTTLASIGDAVVTTDADGTINFLNPIAEKLTGWNNADAAGLTMDEVFRIVHKTTREPVQNPVEKVLEHGGIVGLANHTLLIAKDGTERPIDDSAAPILLADGTFVGCILVFRDITEKARIERDLSDARTRLDAALEAGAIATWTWNIPANRLVPDANMVRLFSIPPELAGGCPVEHFIEAVHPDDREEVMASVNRSLSTGERYEAEYRVVQADGGIRCVLANSTPTFLPDGSPESLSGVLVDITSRKQAEADVQARETQLRLATDAAQLGIFAWDAAHDRTSWENTRIYEIFGMQPHEPPLTAEIYARDYSHPDDVKHYQAALEAAAKTGQLHFTGRFVRKDGLPRWIEIIGRISDPVSGSHSKMVGVVSDVTERMKLNEIRRKSEEFQRLVFESVEDFSIFTTNVEGIITSWNRGAENVFGYSEAEAVGNPAAMVFTPEDRAAGVPRKEMDSAIEMGRGSDERWHLRKDGRRFFASGMVRPLSDETNRLIGFTKVARDVTATKLAADALRRGEERYRTLFTSMDQGFCVFEMIRDAAGKAVDYRFLEVNPAFEQQTGMKNAAGRRMREFAPDHDEFWFETYGRVAETGEPLRFQHTGESLQGRSFDLYAFRIGEPSEHKVAVLFTDITHRMKNQAERDRLVNQLTEADRRKDEFLAMLAHELRNPLGAISSGVELVQRVQKPEVLAELRGMIQHQVKHLTHLIDDLLDVSRITQGKIELRKQTVELTAITQKAAELAKPQIDEKRHELSVSTPGEPVLFVADPTRVEQMLSNLLTNAAKYSEPGRAIGLSAKVEGGEVIFRIRDQGYGITPEMLPKIFGLFTQVDATLDRSRGGLGIGLTLVKNLAELHGGSVSAASEGKDKGAEFTLRLPIGQPKPLMTPAIAPPAPTPSRPAQARRRILIIDDNRDTAKMTSRLLAHQGYEMMMAHDGFEGIEAAKAFEPHVILLDIGLPGLNGYEVASAIRDHECCRDSIFVAVSGYGEAAARERSKEVGIDHHLTKPVDFDQLDDILRNLPQGAAE